jgi:hypothetical protein
MEIPAAIKSKRVESFVRGRTQSSAAIPSSFFINKFLKSLFLFLIPEFKAWKAAYFVVGSDGDAGILTLEVILISAVENAAGKTRNAAVRVSHLNRDVSVLLSQD